MKMQNNEGAIYYNIVTKNGKTRYIILAASGQLITGRDKQRTKSRTFTQEHQAEKWLTAHGYTAI